MRRARLQCSLKGMGSVIVLLELDPSAEVIEPAEADLSARVRWVHAAGADLDVPEDPLARTLCGLDTGGMAHEPYRPAAPGEPWYPPELYDRRCRECEAVLRSL